MAGGHWCQSWHSRQPGGTGNTVKHSDILQRLKTSGDRLCLESRLERDTTEKSKCVLHDYNAAVVAKISAEERKSSGIMSGKRVSIKKYKCLSKTHGF